MKHDKKVKVEEKDWDLDCLMNDIRRVELAKVDKPELYNKALSKLKGEAKQILSIEDLKERGRELAEGDESEDTEDDK